ncbi:Clavaminate synthase-like protein [Periconia macrospinosa]|uniref:Clavaminate synthase-like protein n=1 Tax=Periconia macrospinosa TaxID=97972 RepID=A0A2V1DRY2_9PLEO|nr:Clavaminate synthase-like protein [Periconia macrospinosa]
MASFGKMDLPIIDYQSLDSKDSQRSRTPVSLKERSRLYSALKDTGFAYLKHPRINQATIDSLFSHTKKFFAKPLEEKIKIKGELEKGRGPSQGYSNPAKLAKDPKTSDLKEFFGMYYDEDTEKPNQWLEDEESTAMRADLVAFFESCHLVILELLSALAEEVGMSPETLHPYIAEKNHFIACLHYPGTKADAFEFRTRAAPHTDYGCLTLLFNDSKEGLQVLTRNGTYEYVPRIDDCAVLNVGDLTSRFFNGILPSTMHRVVQPPSSSTDPDAEIPSRYSLAFFGHYNLSTLVKPLDPLVSEASPARFEPIEAGEHVKARVRQLHVAGHSLKENAGGVVQSQPHAVVSASA